MSLIASRLDHLVIIAANLAQGCDYCEEHLGVRPLKGGQHVRMGTHNCLLRLGDDVYLEVIAVDPAAPPLDRPRWFGMDEAMQRLRANRSPFLATFVAATRHIALAVTDLPELGGVHEMQRDALSWQITVRDDGALIEAGAVPVLVQWPDGVHPTQNMPDLGCRLTRLEVFHPQAGKIEEKWHRIGLSKDKRLSVQASAVEMPWMRAHVSTPAGDRIIG